MLCEKNITALRMIRQHLVTRAAHEEYDRLYRDVSPGQNVYWNGFGDPPSISYRADFNDIEYNRERQAERKLVKGRFGGGNIGWIEKDDLELFIALYAKTSAKRDHKQYILRELIEREGPINISQMKESTGYLVKEITPALHKLQEAFLVYEDQYDGQWDRGWCMFSEMFPDVNPAKYTRNEALMKILLHFAHRHVYFDTKMAKSFYKLPEKEITAAALAAKESGELVSYGEGYLLKDDEGLLSENDFEIKKSVFAMHRNDFLVKSNEHVLKEKFRREDCDTLQYLLIDGEFAGAVAGHFKNGPYILEDVILTIPEEEAAARRNEIIDAIYCQNSREHSPLPMFGGKP